MVQTELHVTAIRCVSRADALPFEVVDASRSEQQLRAADTQLVTVAVDTRLENRCIDLRTPANQAIFTLQSKVCQVSWGLAGLSRQWRGQHARHWPCANVQMRNCSEYSWRATAIVHPVTPDVWRVCILLGSACQLGDPAPAK